MSAYNCLRVFNLSLVLILSMTLSALAGTPTINHVMVTDVSTVSFSVVWSASEASMADLAVFQDADGTSSVADAVVTPHPVKDASMATSISEAAEDSGVMKVMVTGLQPDTTYYFQTITTSKSTSDTTYSPVSAPLTAVTTEYETVRSYQDGADVLPFSNDVIIEPCYDGSTPADGSILIATVSGGKYPITAFVGDGVDSPYALIDLNNMFSMESSGNLDLELGESLTLVNFRGMNGNSVVSHSVPLDLDLAEIKEGDGFLQEGWNFFSVQLEPNDPAISSVLSSIASNVDSVWAWDAESGGGWLSWQPPFVDTLSEMHSLTGYWVYMNSDASLRVEGSFVFSDEIPLFSGWNLVGYRDVQQVAFADAIEPISSNINSIWTREGLGWISYNPPFTQMITTIDPGKAYWVNVASDCTW